MTQLAITHDDSYRRGHPFTYRTWLYRPFIKAVVQRARLKAGSTVLDVGCGQGFFTRQFADLGLKPLGIDMNADQIHAAKQDHGMSAARFELAEALSLNCEDKYDCVFVRGFSLYNERDLERTHTVTRALLRLLKPGGIMIFAYGTNLCPRKKTSSWTYHSLSDAKKYFSSYTGARVYFSLRLETLLFGKWAFVAPLTSLCALISRTTGLGGELIAFVPRA